MEEARLALPPAAANASEDASAASVRIGVQLSGTPRRRVNVQLAVAGGDLFGLEANPRASERDPGVGLGFGLERRVMSREGYPNIERGGRSLSYVDGGRLNI